jgi:hypothetical protein
VREQRVTTAVLVGSPGDGSPRSRG